MKGLIYKDIIVNKINFISMGIIIIYIIISLTVFTSLGVNDEIQSFIFTSVLGGLFALNFAFPSCPLESSNEDSKTKWNSYAMALPGGIKRIILEKYMLVLICQLLAVVLSFILIFSCSAIFDFDSFETKMLIMWMMLLVGIMLISLAFIMPFILRSKTGVTQIIAGCIVISLFIGIYAYIALGDISFFTQKDLFLKVLKLLITNEKKMWIGLSILVSIGALLQYLSYRICVLLYKKD